MTHHKSRRIFKFLLLLVLFLLVAPLLLDFVKPFVLSWLIGYGGCEVLVVDLLGLGVKSGHGVCVVRGLSVDGFRVVGASPVKVVVFVGHGLRVVKPFPFVGVGEFALETSERFTLTSILLHPLMVLTCAVVHGSSGKSSEVLAVTKNIFSFSFGFRGKIIVLATCGYNSTASFARSFLEHGAIAVAYFNHFVSVEKIRRVLEVVVRDYGNVSKMLRELRALGMKIETR